MIVLAHILGIPVEESLVPLVSSVGAGTVLWSVGAGTVLRLVGTIEHRWKNKRTRSFRK
jgi:uncharacterized membrane protein YczE